MELTKRLLMVADLVPVSESIADIGTDHAYIPIYLFLKNKIKHAIASDIHKGPLTMAETHIKYYGLESHIEARLGAGLSALKKEECEGVVIAGMGGLMIRNILQESSTIANSLSWAVLQPMNHASDLRIWLTQNGWKIVKEKLAKEDKHIYEAMYVIHGNMELPSELLAEIGVTEERKQDSLCGLHIEKLMAHKKKVIKGIPSNTMNKLNKEKREKAIKELMELEAFLCQLKLKNS